MTWNEFKEALENTVGIKEKTTLHSSIVAEYNMINPLPRGYIATTNDPWCAIYASRMWYYCMDGWFPYECSCTKMVALAQKQSRFFHQNEMEIAKSGYLIFHDWERDGSPDHVGYITDVNLYNHKYSVIEGNYQNQVVKRTIDIGAKNIYGYISLHYPQGSEVDVAKEWATRNGIILGDGTADSWTKPVTREQLAVILARYHQAT